jgi:coenzyme F420-0:L-glutamate ligase / coenzyme F420-1:gamma-L-glutamate ligase
MADEGVSRTGTSSPAALTIVAVDGVPEVRPGDDLVALLARSLAGLAWPDGSVGVTDGDIVAVTSKVVSKAEGRVVRADDREDAITAETVRLVASVTREGRTTRIVENRQGLIMAAAGVDASNTEHGTVLLLPEDPDDSARSLLAGLRERLGARVGVVVTDTVGRPWRTGMVELAIGAAGLQVVDDLRGHTDSHGRALEITLAAVADEIACAVELVTGKTSGRPVAVVRGLAHLLTSDDGPGARTMHRSSQEDLFSLGTAEAYAAGWKAALESIGRSAVSDRPDRAQPI